VKKEEIMSSINLNLNRFKCKCVECGRVMLRSNHDKCYWCRIGANDYPNNNYLYFVYEPDGEFLYFPTLEKAVEHAESVIPGYDVDGWMEEVNQIVVGKITHVTKQTNVKKSDNPNYAYICDYELEAIRQKGGEG
jgi:hypothetical protein